MSNSGFTKVSHLAGQMSDLNVSDLKVSDLSAVKGLIGLSEFSRNQLVAYAPVGFSALGAAGMQTLLNAPGLPPATAVTDASVAHLPPGALVESVQIVNNGTVIAGNTNLGVGVGTVINGAIVDPLATAVLLATLNAGAVVSHVDPTVLDGTYSTVPAVVAPNDILNILNGATANTAGDLKVVVTYLLPA